MIYLDIHGNFIETEVSLVFELDVWGLHVHIPHACTFPQCQMVVSQKGCADCHHPLQGGPLTGKNIGTASP